MRNSLGHCRLFLVCTMLLVCSMILASPGLMAQVTSPATITNLVRVESQNCPVEFSARRWGSGAVEYTDAKPTAHERGIFLRFHRSGTARNVASLTAIVHGSDYSLHIHPVGASSGSDLTQIFHLTKVRRDSDGAWELTTGQVPLVKEVDIVAMTFADGTAWGESDATHCRVQPDGLILVASDR